MALWSDSHFICFVRVEECPVPHWEVCTTTTCSLQVVTGKLSHHFGMKSHRCADLQNVILNIRHNPETMSGASSCEVGSHLSGDLPLARSNSLEMKLSAWSTLPGGGM